MANGHKGAVLRQIQRIFSLGTVSGMSEAQLLERFVAFNDKAAFEAIVARHGPMVWGVCRRVLTDPHTAEDAFQATFLVLLKKAGSLRDPGRLSPWLYGVALRVATRARSEDARRNARERDVAKEEAVEPIVLDDLGCVRAVIDEELNRLPERYRWPVVLCHLEGKSYEEAAHQLCWTEGMVRGRLARGRERLRTGLTRRGLAPSAALITAALSGESATAAVPASLVAATIAVARIVTLGGAMTTTTLGPILKLAEGVLTTMLFSKLKLTGTLTAIGAVIVTALPIAFAYDEKPKSHVDKPTQNTKLQAPSDRAVELIPKANTATQAIDVRVLDQQTGEPLTGVTLEVWINDQPKIEGKTDRVGHYSFELPQANPNSLQIKAKTDGFVPASMAWGLWQPGVFPVPKALQFMLEPGTSIGGTIQDTEGRPVEEATVFLLLPSKGDKTQQQTNVWDYPVKTDDHGRWRCDIVPSKLDDIWIRLQHPDYISDTRYGSTPKPTIAQLRDQTGVMVLKKGLPVTGQVFSHDGQPIAGANIAQGANRPGGHEPEVKTNAKGRFKFDHVAPGDLVLTVQAAGRAPDLKTVKVIPKMSPVEFRLEPGHVVRGRVVDPEGKPVAGVWIVADEWRGHRSLSLETKSQADGSFQVFDAPADTVLFQFAKAPAFRNLMNLPLAASEVGHVVKMIRPVTVRGSVVDSESGKPIEAFTLIRGDDPKGKSTRWERNRPLRFRDGHYEVSLDWPYPVQGLLVEADGYLPAISHGFSIMGPNQVYDFKLTRGKVPTRAALTGVVRLPDESPAADAEVGLATNSHGIYVRNGSFSPPNQFPTVRTGIDGRFAFPPQTEAATILVLDDRGFAQVTEEQLLATDSLTLTPWGQVEGTLRIGNKAGAFEEVSLSPKAQSQSDDQRISYHYNVATDTSGHFLLTRVIPGAASISRTIKLSANSYGDGRWYPILVEASQTVQATIGGQGRPVTGRVISLAGTKTALASMTSRNTLLLQAPLIPMPKGLTREQRIEWYNAWIVTEEAEAYREYLKQRSILNYPVKVEPDGTFRIEDVEPGTYELHLRFDLNRLPVARASLTVTVPEIPGGRSDIPIELGEVKLIPGEPRK